MTSLEFNYRLIEWTCRCGTSPLEHKVTIGVSSLADLIATWTCENCGEEVMARIPLEQILSDLPPQPVPSTVDNEFTEEDRDWLDKAHIKLHD